MGVRHVEVVFEGVPAPLGVEYGDAFAVLVHPPLKEPVPDLYGGDGGGIGSLGVNEELLVKAALVVAAGRG